MKKVLVTGGAGFIGSCFVRQMVADEAAHVVNSDELSYAGNLDSLEPVLEDPLHTLIQGDIVDREHLEHVFHKHQPDAVVHFAAESHVDRSIDNPDEFVRTNCSNNYGPYQFPEKLIPLMILNAIEGKPLPIFWERPTWARLAIRDRHGKNQPPTGSTTDRQLR